MQCMMQNFDIVSNPSMGRASMLARDPGVPGMKTWGPPLCTRTWSFAEAAHARNKPEAHVLLAANSFCSLGHTFRRVYVQKLDAHTSERIRRRSTRTFISSIPGVVQKPGHEGGVDNVHVCCCCCWHHHVDAHQPCLGEFPNAPAHTSFWHNL